MPQDPAEPQLSPSPVNQDPSNPDWITQQQRQALTLGANSVNDEPDKAARAIELSKSSGVPAAAIYPDVEQFEEQHKAQLTDQILRNNPDLIDYVNSHPLAAAVSANDWGNMSDVADKMARFLALPVAGLPLQKGGPADTAGDAALAAVKAFSHVWDRHEGEDIFDVPYADYRGSDQWNKDYPFLSAQAALFGRTFLGIPIEAGKRTYGGTVAAAGAAIQVLARRAGMDEDSVQRLPEDLAQLANDAMTFEIAGGFRTAGAPKPTQPHIDAARAKVYDDINKTLKPYLESGEKPPTGLHPIIDQIYYEQAKTDMKALEEFEKAADKAGTKEMAPQIFEDWIRDKAGDTHIGIPSEVVQRLYGDKDPEEDDKILGWVPGIKQQLDAAKTWPTDIQVPIAGWIARADPDIREVLRPDVRLRQGGYTLNEVEEAADQAKATKEAKLEPVDTTKVHDDALAQLKGAGLSDEQAEANATMVASRYGALASRLKEDPFELYKKQGLWVRRGEDATGEGKQFQQPELKAPTFYSALARAVDTSKTNKASPEQWVATLKNQPGVKPDELEHMDVVDWLQSHKTSVTKQELSDYLRANALDVSRDVVYTREGAEDIRPRIAEFHDRINDLSDEEYRIQQKIRDTTPPRHYIEGGRTGWTIYAPDPTSTEEWAEVPLFTGASREEVLRKAEEAAFAKGEPSPWGDIADLQKQLNEKREERRRITAELEEMERKQRDAAPRWENYALPGGKDPREILVTLNDSRPSPLTPEQEVREQELSEEADRRFLSEEEMAEQRHFSELRKEQKLRQFNSTHWTGVKNIIVHLRMDTRFEPNPEGGPDLKVLHLNEMQSDWHQQGRKKGYYDPSRRVEVERAVRQTEQALAVAVEKVNVASGSHRAFWSIADIIDRQLLNYREHPEQDEDFAQARYPEFKQEVLDYMKAKREESKGGLHGVPDAPFKTTWDELAFKRLVRHAAEHGFDRITWAADAQTVRQIENWPSLRKTEDGKWLIGTSKDVTPIVERYITDLPRIANKMLKKFNVRTGKTELTIPKDSDGYTHRVLNARGETMDRVWDERQARDIVQNLTEDYPEEGPYTFEEIPKEPDKRTVNSIDITPKLAESVIREGFPLFQRDQMTGRARGQITMTDGKAVVDLFKNADASTFQHEMAHLWLEELARFSDRSPEMKKDLDTVLKWLGVEKFEDVGTQHHEQFAQAWEQYLAEGKAPSKELQGVFEKFKQWLMQIYKSFTGPINDDIRGVMDRMVATDEQINAYKGPPIDEVDAVKRSAGMQPMAAPALYRIRRVPKEPDDDTPGHVYDIEDNKGNRVGGGTVTESEDGLDLRVDNIAVGTAKGIPNALGPRQLTYLLRQLQQDFPQATHVTGLDIRDGEGKEVRFPLRPSKTEINGMGTKYPATEVTDHRDQKIKIKPEYTTTVGELQELKDIVQFSSDPLAVYFGENILDLASDVPVHIVPNRTIHRILGFDGAGVHTMSAEGHNQIFISSDANYWPPSFTATVLFHEASHAATVAAMATHPELKAKVQTLMNELESKLTREQRQGPFDYAYTNPLEFVAEAQAKKELRDIMQQIPASPELRAALNAPSIANMWHAFINIFRETWAKITGKPINDTILESFLQLSEEIFTQQELDNAAWNTPGGVYRGGMVSGAKQLELPGITRMEDRDAFERARDIGMTSKQFGLYKEQMNVEAINDMEHFREKAENIERTRQTKEWQDNESRIYKEVRSDLDNRPDIAAENLLRDGVLFGQKLKGRTRLNSDLLTPEQKSLLQDDYHQPGGINPQDAAHTLGYQTVDQMLQGLKAWETEKAQGGAGYLKRLAEGLTQERMKREYGNLEENIISAAQEHVLSDTPLDRIHQEVLALATKFGGKSEIPIKKDELGEWIQKQFSSMPIAQHDVANYLKAAGKADNEAELSRLEGNIHDAFKSKQQNYINLRLAQLAKNYEKERSRLDNIAKQLRNPRYGGMDNNYLAHARNILQNSEIPTGRSVQGLEEDVRKAGDLQSFAKAEAELSHVQFLFPDWVWNGEKKPLSKMTYEEFKGLYDSIQQLHKLGRAEKSYLTRAGKFALRSVVDDKAIPQLEKQGVTGTPYNLVKGVDKWSEGLKTILYGKLIQTFSVLNRFDLGDKHGFFNMNVVYPAMQAASGLSHEVKFYSGKLNEAFEPIRKLDMKKALPNLLKRKSRDEMVNMTLENAQRLIMDSGNPNNLMKMTKGWGISQEALWQWFQKNTTPEMWDAWQKVGDVNAEIFDKLKAMIRSENGVVPDKVELVPFLDPWGVERKGWYSPMIYDQKELGASRKADGKNFIDPEEMGGLFDTGYFKTSTATGAEINRTGYYAPTDLTMNRLPQRMSQILYDTAFRPFVMNFGKMLRDTEFRHAIMRHAGEPVLHMMDDWLRDLIGGSKGINTASDAYLNASIEFMRRNLIGSLIGWNVHTAQKHGMTAAMTSMAEVGMRNFAREFNNMMTPGNFKATIDFAMSKSFELQRRRQNWSESLGGQFEGLRFGDKGFWAARNWMLDKGSLLVSYSDLISAVPSWMAEYRKQMDLLGRKFPDKLPEDYEGTAIEIADSVVLRAHGSTAITSRPGVMRGGATGRLFTSLYSVFNQMLQRNFEAYWRTKYVLDNPGKLSKEEIQNHLGKAALLVVTSSLWPVLVEHMVTPDPDDKKGTWYKTFGKYALEMSTLGIPLAREAVHGFLTSGEPGVGMLDTGLKELASSFNDIAHGVEALNKERGGKTIKDFTNLIGLASGLPGEAGNLLEEAWNVMAGAKQAPRNPAEAYRATTTGKAIGQPDVIQRAIELPTPKGRRR